MAEAKDVRAGHRRRLRDKFSEHGLAKFTPEEIVELLLTFGTPRRDCKQAARGLLARFGDIRAVFEADPAELAAVTGVGPNNVTAIKFIFAVAGEYLEQRLIGREYLGSPQKVHQYLKHHLENLDKEVFKVIHLDSSGAVITLENVSRGTVDGAVVHPRELLERALDLRASSLVFAHNHPSGKTRPSAEDFRITRQLVHAAFLVEMKVLDHLVVGRRDAYYSFRDHGHLDRFESEIREFHRRQGRPE